MKEQEAPSSVWIVVAAALAAGLGESAFRYATRVLLHRPTFLNPQSVWLGPLLSIGTLAIPAAAVFLVSRSERRPNRLVFLGVFLVALELLLLVPRIAPWVDAILAIGFAMEAARQAARYPGLTLRLAKGFGAVLVA